MLLRLSDIHIRDPFVVADRAMGTYRTAEGGLLMLWPGFRNGRYVQGAARSESGGILGSWLQEPLFTDDGGHGMLFKTFADDLMLTLHRPNGSPNERPPILPVTEKGGKLSLS